MEVDVTVSNNKGVMMNNLSHFSHEVRTELSSIIGIASYLQNHPEKIYHSDLIEYISQAGENITKSLEKFVGKNRMGKAVHFKQAFQTSLVKPRSKVLIIDDSAKVRKHIKMLFRNQNCVIEIAKTGFEALNKALNKFHLILVDTGLEDMDVLELVSDLRKVQPNVDCKIVGLSVIGHDYFYDLLRAGANDIVSKFSAPERIRRLLTLETTPMLGL